MADLIPRNEPTRIPDEGTLIEVGQWYWINDPDEESSFRNWFGCVVEIGSNYVGFQDAFGSSCRVHLNDFEKECRRELMPLS